MTASQTLPKVVLVTGAAGRLGSCVTSAFRACGLTAFGLGRRSCAQVDFVADIADERSVRGIIEEISPDIIVHAAAMTDVEACERDPVQARLINTVGTVNIVRAAADLGSYVLGISTDYVFSGNRGAPYFETDQPTPNSVYGQTKLEGEMAILSASPSYAVVRTAWLYGGLGRSFPRSVFDMLAQGRIVEAVIDEVGSPTYTGDLAASIVSLSTSGQAGIHHVAGATGASRFELACHIASLTGSARESVLPVTSEEFRSKHRLCALRPCDARLKSMRSVGKPPIRGYQEVLSLAVLGSWSEV